MLDWIWESVKDLEFDTALDLFGGTGAVAYLFKTKGKAVTYNDRLRSNYLIAKGLVENSRTSLGDEDIERILRRDPRHEYDNFVQRTFNDIFFLPEENHWLDLVAQNIARLKDADKAALAYFALFQAAIAKRPYNLFHRANLYLRLADVDRSFGNKATWDKPFEEHFRAAAHQANRAVFDNGRDNRALNLDASETEASVDLVYIDPPYMNAKGVGTDYLDYYHFLEGLSDYGAWSDKIDARYKHRPYQRGASPWLDRKRIAGAFEQVFARFPGSILVVSYRDNGIPAPGELLSLLKRHRTTVAWANYTEYKYVLSKVRSRELLLIGE